MRWKYATALALAVAALSEGQPAYPSQSHDVTDVLHDFYRPTLVSVAVGDRVVFRDTLKSEPITAVANSIRVHLRTGDKVCVSFSDQRHCRMVTASDLSKKYLLVSAETRSSHFAMQFLDKLMLD
jgi:hypothetical protein